MTRSTSQASTASAIAHHEVGQLVASLGSQARHGAILVCIPLSPS